MATYHPQDALKQAAKDSSVTPIKPVNSTIKDEGRRGMGIFTF